MTFKKSITTCFRKYITFSGRAARSEYWWFFLFLILGQIVAGILDGVLFGSVTVETTDTSISAENDGPIANLFGLATLIPSLAAGWRRMHDTGRSGLYLLYPLIAMIGLLSFIGFVGGFEMLESGDPASLINGGLGIVIALALLVVVLSPFVVLFWLTRPSQPGSNSYGPNPYEVPQ